MKDNKKNILTYGRSLARVFSTSVIEDFASKGSSKLVSCILKETLLLSEFDRKTQLSDFFNHVYKLLFKNYRNEYIYKNAIARKILLGTHSLNTTTMLTEFRAGYCKADVIVLNGTSTVYEIKSAYDSMERLTRQISSYRQLFDKINVITSNSQLDKVMQITANDIGVMVLTDRNTISTIREPNSLKNNVNQEIIFDSLRRNEYEQIIRDYFGAVPKVSNAHIYNSCRQLFCTLSKTEAHDAMVNVIRKRSNNKLLRDFIFSVPKSLTAASLSCNLTHIERERFLQLLNMKIENCLAT